MTLKLYGLKEIPLVKKGDNIAKIIEEEETFYLLLKH